MDFGISKEEIIKALVEIPVWKGFDIAKRLEGQFKLCILSDQMQFKTDHIRQNNDLSLFDYIFFSSEIGVKKPSEKLFQMVLDKIKELPQNCLFIDDKIKNIEAAERLGFQVIHCNNIDLLEQQISVLLYATNNFQKTN